LLTGVFVGYKFTQSQLQIARGRRLCHFASL